MPMAIGKIEWILQSNNFYNYYVVMKAMKLRFNQVFTLRNWMSRGLNYIAIVYIFPTRGVPS
jgi:hypothetical protein